MKCCFFALFLFISCSSGGFPKGRTIFRDVLEYDRLVKSYNMMTEIWNFEQEYELSGIFIGSRNQDIVFPTATKEDTYIENIAVNLVEHNGTYGAPRKLIGVGTLNTVQEYNSTIYIPLVAVDRDGRAPLVKPLSFEHTLYYLEIDIISPTPGWYPYYFTRELAFFGAVTPDTIGSGIVVGIEYSKP